MLRLASLLLLLCFALAVEARACGGCCSAEAAEPVAQTATSEHGGCCCDAVASGCSCQHGAGGCESGARGSGGCSASCGCGCQSSRPAPSAPVPSRAPGESLPGLPRLELPSEGGLVLTPLPRGATERAAALRELLLCESRIQTEPPPEDALWLELHVLRN